MPFTSPVAGGGGALIRPVFKSPDFLTGVRGWAIYRDGSAEFNNITARGNITGSSLTITNGNSRIIASADASGGQPAITFNPDITADDNGVIVATIGGDPNVIHLLLQSPKSTGAAGSKSAFISLESGYTGVSSLATIQADAVEATGVAGGSFFEGTAQSNTATTQSATVTPGNSVTIVSATFTALAGRAYEITATWPAVTVGTPVAVPGNRAQMQVFRGATQIAAIPIVAHNTTIGQFGGTIAVTDTPGAGSVTYNLVLLHEAASTAATFRCSGSATAPSIISTRGQR